MVQYGKRVFEVLFIWKEEKHQTLRGTYPVISLSFALIKAARFSDAREMVCQLITELYQMNDFLIKSAFLGGEDAVFFRQASYYMPDALSVLRQMFEDK